MGLEYNRWSNRVTPEHDVTLPFTRMLAGPMDYTPGAFRNSTRGQFKPQSPEPMSQGTRAHQLAMYVVYDSPLVMLSDYPESYRDQPGIEFLKIVPTVWDETKVIHGAVGNYVTIARRSGKEWFIGSMTDWNKRSLRVPLDFLQTGAYEVEVFGDGPDAATVASSLTVSKKKMTKQDSIVLDLACGGGAAAVLTPVD